MSETPIKVEDKILTINQASQFLKLHISTIKRLIEAGEIPSYKLGKRRLFDQDELFRWFKAHKVNGPPSGMRMKNLIGEKNRSKEGRQ